MTGKLNTIFLVICLVCILTSVFSQNKNCPVKIINNGDVLRGDKGPIVYGPPAPLDNSPLMKPVSSKTDDSYLTNVLMSELSTDARSQYDLQSNGVIHYLYVDPANPLHMHAIFMTSTDPAPNWTDRNTRYFYSEDGGVTWSYFGTVGATRSGFPCLSQTPDGRAMISMHNTDGGGIQRGQLYIEINSGSGAFNRLDPGGSYSFPVCAGTNLKALIASTNFSDSVRYNLTSSFTPPGNWTGWRSNTTGVSCNVAFGTAKWGIVFITANGGAAIIESSDQGLTWSNPQQIWNWNAADSLGTLRGIDLIYDGNNPRVVFELAKINPALSEFYPKLPSKEVCWGPDINGGIPVTIDQETGLTGSNPANDVFVSCCRGTIGKDAQGNLFTVYNVAKTDTSSIGNNYFDVYISYSLNHGLSWTPGVQITNLTGQGVLADYRYASISPYTLNMPIYLICGRDTVPGSNVNGAPSSTMREMFIKIYSITFPGIHNIGNEIPASYSLHQNYPNPFNPSTKIRFELPKSGFVSIKLYDVSGKEVNTIVNENLSAGVKELDFNAENFASGIYFYTIKADDFTQTRKMVILK